MISCRDYGFCYLPLKNVHFCTAKQLTWWGWNSRLFLLEQAYWESLFSSFSCRSPLISVESPLCVKFRDWSRIWVEFYVDLEALLMPRFFSEFPFLLFSCSGNPFPWLLKPVSQKLSVWHLDISCYIGPSVSLGENRPWAISLF